MGILLLLLGSLLYGLLSRPVLLKTAHWKYAEIPHTRKIPTNKTQKTTWSGSKEWKEGSKKRGSIAYESRKNHSFTRSFGRDSNYVGNFKLEKQERPRQKKTPFELSLNQADSSDWEQLPGIGPVLAARIVKYREKLGGFHSPSQLKEVFGITDTVYEKIAPRIGSSPATLQKIDINHATIEDLKKHPYIRWETAKAIVRYREAHGYFHSLESLKGIWNISPETIAKIAPYLLASADSLSQTVVGRK